MTRYLGGGARHFFLLNLYNFKNIGTRGGGHVPPQPPYSAVPRKYLRGKCEWKYVETMSDAALTVSGCTHQADLRCIRGVCLQ